MFRNIQTLVAIQEHVLRWRRLAAEVTNPQTARRLRDLADEMEVRAARARPTVRQASLVVAAKRSDVHSSYWHLLGEVRRPVSFTFTRSTSPFGNKTWWIDVVMSSLSSSKQLYGYKGKNAD